MSDRKNKRKGDYMSFRTTSFAVLPIALLLTACGGGGGGGSSGGPPSQMSAASGQNQGQLKRGGYHKNQKHGGNN